MAPRARVPKPGSAKASVFPSPTRSEKAAGSSIAAPPAAITAARALVTTLGCKEALYLVHSGLNGEHHGVVTGHEHVTAGGYDHLFSSQHRSYDSVFGKSHRGQRASGDPAPLGNPELHHLGSACQKGDGYDLSPPYEPKDGASGQQPGR